MVNLFKYFSHNPIKSSKKTDFILKELHSVEGKLAELITDFSGSMMFVYFHVIWFGFWILTNAGMMVPFFHPFDPFPYGLLTMIVSLEAIFLSTFIMLNQNRQELIEEFREIEEEVEDKEAEEEVEDIQKDLNDIKNAVSFIRKKVESLEKTKPKEKNQIA